MNLIILAQRLPFPPNKGEKLRTFNQFKYLSSKGFTTTVITPIESESEIELISAFKKQYDLSVKYIKLRFKLFRYLSGFFKKKPLSVAFFYDKRLQLELDTVLEEDNIDVILCSASSMAEYVFNSSRLNASNIEKPLLLMDFMDVDSDKWSQYAKSSSWPLKWIYMREYNLLRDYEIRVVKRFDHTFLISQHEVDLFNQNNCSSSHIGVLGNGINQEAYYPPDTRAANRNPVFIFTGVMDYRPNIDAVLWFVKHAWPLILRHYPESRFIIAGMNPSTSINKLNKLNGIEVTGFIDDILPYYHQADYFVAPLRIARGVQNKVLQAFACGLPVISSSMGAEGIECNNGVDILIAESGEEYLNAIQQLENDNTFKSKLINNATTLIKEKYSWSGQLKVLDDILMK